MNSGDKFNFLTAVRFHHKTNKNIHWLFLCDCGKEIVIPRSFVISGKYKSCGCYKRSRIVEQSTKHGEAKRGNLTRLYVIWAGIKSRCYCVGNRAFPRYGGRGITMDASWRNDFLVFKEWALLNGYSDLLTIERINNDGNYDPLNCTWISRNDQAANKRNTRWITHNGETLHAAGMAKKYGVPYKTFHKRLKAGYSVQDALSQDVIINDGAKSFWIEDKKGNFKFYKSGGDFERITGFDRSTISSARQRNVKSYKFKQGKVKGYTVHFEIVK